MTRFARFCAMGVVAAMVLAAPVAMAKDAPKADARAKTGAASRPADFLKNLWNRMPAPIDQTITRENTPQDKLRIDITHSHLNKEGKHVALVRVVWGDLDNLIKGGGKEYYSNWDGKVTLDGATGEVIHKIAFDDKEGLVHRPVRKVGGAASRPAKETAKPESPIFKPAPAEKSPLKAAAKAMEKTVRHDGPGPGSGRDELEESAGKEISWKAGVVGALDGLLIKVTSDSADITGTIVTGKFTVPLKITGGAEPMKPARKVDKMVAPAKAMKR